LKNVVVKASRIVYKDVRDGKHCACSLACNENKPTVKDRITIGVPVVINPLFAVVVSGFIAKNKDRGTN